MSLIADIIKVSKDVNNDRSNLEILAHIMEEVGELAQETIIHDGLSYKSQGSDGIVGEAVDAIISIVDLVMRTHPEVTEYQLQVIAAAKMNKWKTKTRSQ